MDKTTTNKTISSIFNWILPIVFSGIFVIAIGLYIWQFKYGLSDQSIDWANFGQYLGGLTTPIISTVAAYILLLEYKAKIQKEQDDRIENAKLKRDNDIEYQKNETLKFISLLEIDIGNLLETKFIIDSETVPEYPMSFKDFLSKKKRDKILKTCYYADLDRIGCDLLLEIGYLVNMLNILLQKATSAGTEYHMYYFQKYKLLIDKLKNQDSVIYEKMAIYGDTDPDVQFLKITIPKLN